MKNGDKIYNKKDQATILLFIVAILLVLLGFLFLPKQEESLWERRKLADNPKLNWDAVMSGEFMEDAEAYLLDHFPGRNEFRKIKAHVDHYVLRKKDVEGYFYDQGHLSKLQMQFSEKALEEKLRKQEEIYHTLVEGKDCNVYISIVPDKNYFLREEGKYPAMDYEKYESMVKAHSQYGNYVSLFDKLTLSDYYKTDPHWRQEALEEVVLELGTAMGKDFSAHYEKKTSSVPFYGAYYGQAALSVKPDQISYLENETLRTCTVCYLTNEGWQEGSLYDHAALEGRDPYEMFLAGAKPCIVMEKQRENIEKEQAIEKGQTIEENQIIADAQIIEKKQLINSENSLVIFRDSFASSLAPLLLEGYDRIILVDLRYMNASVLEDYVDIQGCDVLFLSSTLIW